MEQEVATLEEVKVHKAPTAADGTDLESLTLRDLYRLARELEISGYSALRKRELIMEITKARTEKDGLIFAQGILDIMAEGYGFLRPVGYLPSNEDVYVSPSQIRRFDLRTGDLVAGYARPPKENSPERYFGMLRIEQINGVSPEEAAERLPFDNLTPIFPTQRYTLEISPIKISARLVDLVAPIGKGQRAMVVSPPKAGKTMLLKDIANSISRNYPDAHIMVLLVDERPEEVTDMERSIQGEVLASTFDNPPENHVKLAEIVIERAKRLVEHRRDVVILLDSITRLARAYNLVTPPSGRTLSGGLDPASLHKPKRFLGAARNIEEGGSLTIIATALVNTESRMDDVIYEEFKGTGNMELHLDRKLSERRMFPAVDIKKSGTRREELLLAADELEVMWLFRRSTGNMEPTQVLELMMDRLQKTKDNREFLDLIRREARLTG
jgi:transcription termination factor Rho